MRPRAVIAPALLAAAGAAFAAEPVPATRGALLYATHCATCHGEQMHWRAKRSATDWPSLREQVRRWQGEAKLGWTDEDIDAVARHLNDTIYGFPSPRQLARR